MIHYDDYDLQVIEREIINSYDNTRDIDYSNLSCLLEVRKRMLNKQALSHQEELLPEIIAFNDALIGALKEMYDEANALYKQITAIRPKIYLEARCYLSGLYTERHPYQTNDRQDLWTALCDSGWNPMYEEGVAFEQLYLLEGSNECMPFEEFIGMDCPPLNWNEGLDQELTKDLHLISAFHNLFDHTNFALTDFIFCRDFSKMIQVDISVDENKKYLTAGS